MNPTHHEVTASTVTAADTLREAGVYLLWYGWHQGDMFADPDQPTPPACALGAIRMAVHGTTVVSAENFCPQQLAAFDAAVSALGDHLVLCHGAVPVADPFDPDTATDLEQVIVDWNDQPDRIAAHVIAAFYGAADEWDRLHDAPQQWDDPAGGDAR